MSPHHCAECGKPYSAKRLRADNAFCSPACRDTFGNRRKIRGAQLYDLFMILRYERGVAKAKGVWALACRLAQDWREEDTRQRQGRQSWRSYDAVHQGLAPQRAEKLSGLDYNSHRAAVENGISARSMRG